MDAISSEDAARMLGVSRMTLWRWVKSGKAEQTVAIGKHKFFTKYEIKRLREVEANPS